MGGSHKPGTSTDGQEEVSHQAVVTVEATVRVSQDYKNAKPQNWGICNGEEMESRAIGAGRSFDFT